MQSFAIRCTKIVLFLDLNKNILKNLYKNIYFIYKKIFRFLILRKIVLR